MLYNSKYTSFLKGQVLTLSSGCYECRSQCRSGCNVVNLGGNIGCSACEGEDKGKDCIGRSCDDIMMLQEAGLIDLNAGIQLINDDETIATLRTDLPSMSVLEKINSVSKEIDRFIQEVWREKTDFNRGKWAVVNFFGAATKMWVPADHPTARVMDEGGASCHCVEGSGCVYEAIYRMGIKIGELCRSNG